MKKKDMVKVKRKIMKGASFVRGRKKGSVTVEASLLIPMAVMAAGIMISLCIHVYQRCWCTQAACETVLAGSTQGILKGSSGAEKAEERWKVLREECYPVPERFLANTGGNEDQVKVKITGETPVWGRKGIQMDITVSQKMIRPVKFIRKAAALKGGRE